MAHIEARREGSFDNPNVTTHKQVIEALLNGKTIDNVLIMIELRFCNSKSVGSLAYVKGVKEGFKRLLINHIKNPP
jgi:hypothetical protein